MTRSRPASPATLDRNEAFPHLSNAPIVEAVIDARARPEAPWDEGAVSPRLRAAIPEYSKVRNLRGLSVTAEFGLVAPAASTGGAQAHARQEDHGWLGIRAESPDGLQVATFTRDGFSFHRLRPYQDWGHFGSEARRLWAIYADVGAVSEVRRLGVRFIDRFSVPAEGLRADEYFRGFGDTPGGLPGIGFMHTDLVQVPGHPYAVNVIRTMQRSDDRDVALILDIDAFCPEPSPTDGRMMAERLADLRVVKNRVFFGSVTERALDLWK